MSSPTTELAPNTRIHALRSWLSKPPGAAKELYLRASAGIDAPDVQLGLWSVDEVVPALAVEIVEMLDEHASTIAGPVQARLAFVNAAGGEVKTKALVRSTSHVAPPESLSDVQLDGSAKSQVTQAQAFAQAAIQQLLRSNALVLAQSVELSKHATEVAATLAEEMRALRSRQKSESLEAERVRDELARLSESNATPEEGAGALAKLLEPHMPVLVQMLQIWAAKAA